MKMKPIVIALFVSSLSLVVAQQVQRAPGTHHPAAREPILPPPPPDPGTVAPPLDSSQATEALDAVSFLFSGASPIQSGVALETIVRERVAVLRGRVVDAGGAPLPSATVRIVGHAELGSTLTRTDGAFDLAVNGGGPLVVSIGRPGSLQVQRTVDVPWQEFVHVPEIVLTPLDPVVTSIDLTAPVAMQVARASVCTDADGTRQSTMLFPQGMTANLVFPGGATQPISGLSVRATEYTVGTPGPAAMPGDLPPTSGYTYAVEFSLDEGINGGATRVDFSVPVLNYTENFLGFPVGTAIPVGYYDRAAGAWKPEPNGVVLKVLSITGGLADLDVTGGGTPATPAQLASLGITDAERASVATLYSAGQSLWRVRLNHFSAHDYNYPVGLPWDSGPPPDDNDRRRRGPCQFLGSVLRPSEQTVGERLPITGTPYALHYVSDRVPGGAGPRSHRVVVTDSLPPSSMLSARVTADIAGQHHQWSFTSAANQSFEFSWDGKDAYGRLMQGLQPCRVRVSYLYDLVYLTPAAVSASFGLPPANFTTIGNANRAQGEITTEYTVALGNWDARAVGLGGWTFDVHHSYEPTTRRLNLGTGDSISADDLAVQVLRTSVPASTLTTPYGVACAPDGTLYVADRGASRVFKRAVDGTITVFAGGGTPPDGIGDGLPATQASIVAPEDVDVDAKGRVYIADHNGHRIRRVDLDGIITTVAGSGPIGFTNGATSGDEGPATSARMNRPRSVAVDASGGFYVAEWQSNYVRYVDPAGIIHTVAGNGSATFSGDGGLARSAGVVRPTGVAVHPDGGFYVVDQQTDRIRYVGIDGRIQTVAGNGTAGSAGDGGQATLAQLFDPSQVFVTREGELLIADMNNHKIRRVGRDGAIRTLVGTGTACANASSPCGDGEPAPLGSLNQPRGVCLAPDGSLYIADSATERVRQVLPTMPGLAVGDFVVPSSDAAVVYVFDGDGRHLRTCDALSGVTLTSFQYDAARRLASITDESGNVTTITRDATGVPTAIVAPRGQSTGLALDAAGWLQEITSPDASAHRATYTATGSMLTWSDPLGHTSTFTYDPAGRLTRDNDATGAAQTLSRTVTANGDSITLTSPLGRTRSFASERLSDGRQLERTTMPGGALSETVLGTDGSEVLTMPDGSVELKAIVADPRFGLTAPIVATETLVTPAGRTRTITRARSVSLSNPLDPLSVVTHTSTERVNGLATTGVYTAATRTLVTTSPAGRTRTQTFDSAGRLVLSQQGGLSATTYSYDALGRMIASTSGTGGSARTWAWTWDASGNLSSVTNPLGQTTGLEHDLQGRTTKEVLPDGNEIRYGYDATGQQVSLTPPQRPAHTFTYTPVGLPASYTAPDLGLGTTTTVALWNGDRQLTALDRPGSADLTYGYDPTGLLSSVTLPQAALSLDYEGPLSCCSLSERLVEFLRAQAGGPTLSLTRTYDGFLPLVETLTGSVAGTVERAYDDFFRVTTEKVNGGSQVTFGYDADGLLTTLGNLTLTRDAQHGLVTATAQANVTTTHVYNSFGEVLEMHAFTGATEVFGYVLTRDALGRIVQKVENVLGTTATLEYVYDARGRLVESRRNGSVLATYAYDANGNRTSRTDAGGTQTGTHDVQDRLLSWGATTYQHSEAGVRVQSDIAGQVTAYQYDALGNLLGVTLPGGTQIDYSIAAWTWRTAKSVDGVPVQGLLYRANLQPVAELDSAGALLSRFVYSPEERVPLYFLRGGSTYRILTDHLGSPRLVVDVGTGSVAQLTEYDEFGAVTADTNPGFQPFGFAGGLHDPDTGLVRLGWRDYDPQTGRFLAKDPLLFEGGDTNLYAYAGSDPVNRVDPDGRSFKQCLGSLWEKLCDALKQCKDTDWNEGGTDGNGIRG